MDTALNSIILINARSEDKLRRYHRPKAIVGRSIAGKCTPTPERSDDLVLGHVVSISRAVRERTGGHIHIGGLLVQRRRVYVQQYSSRLHNESWRVGDFR